MVVVIVVVVVVAMATEAILQKQDMGVSENRGPQYSTLNSRLLIIRTPK